jgi:hypothetical protein
MSYPSLISSFFDARSSGSSIVAHWHGNLAHLFLAPAIVPSAQLDKGVDRLYRPICHEYSDRMASDSVQARLSGHECLVAFFSHCRLFTVAAIVFATERSQ